MLLKQEILLALFIKSVNCKENKTSSLLDFSTYIEGNKSKFTDFFGLFFVITHDGVDDA